MYVILIKHRKQIKIHTIFIGGQHNMKIRSWKKEQKKNAGQRKVKKNTGKIEKKKEKLRI